MMGEPTGNWVKIKLDALKVTLKMWLADIAMRWCGPEVIYWTAPERWTEYMSVGEPFVACEWCEGEHKNAATLCWDCSEFERSLNEPDTNTV